MGLMSGMISGFMSAGGGSALGGAMGGSSGTGASSGADAGSAMAASDFEGAKEGQAALASNGIDTSKVSDDQIKKYISDAEAQDAAKSQAKQQQFGKSLQSVGSQMQQQSANRPDSNLGSAPPISGTYQALFGTGASSVPTNAAQPIMQGPAPIQMSASTLPPPPQQLPPPPP